MKCVLIPLICVFVAAVVGILVFVVLWIVNTETEFEYSELESGLDGGFRVRFGITKIGVDHFIELPQTVSAAINQSWNQASRANDVLPDLTLYCHNSYIVCVLYDDTEYVAGLQIAFPEAEFTDAVYDWEVQGFSAWNPGNGNTYWATQQYFVDDEFLATSAEERLAARDASKTLQAGGVWVSGVQGELVLMKSTATGILANGFTEQACIPFMGVHYYRNMTTELECNEELFPWFALTDTDEELIATGLVVYGQFQEKAGDWFERPMQAEVEMIVPRGPECLYNLAASPGLVTMHVYYINEPWTIFC